MTAGVVAALVAPVVLDRDGFPLSTYPMYSRARGDSVTFVTAQAVTTDGTTSPLTLAIIGRSDDPLVVAGELRTAIRRGVADVRCDDIAERAARWLELPTGAVAVEVVSERHDVVAQVSGDASLLAREVHARCPIGAS